MGFSDTKAFDDVGATRVIKRDGAVVLYDDAKIKGALLKAFAAAEGSGSAASEGVRRKIDDLTTAVTIRLKGRLPTGGTVHIETIQDQVELALMRAGEHQTARRYVLYREERSQARSARENEAEANGHDPGIPADASLAALLENAAEGVADVDVRRIWIDAQTSMYDGIAPEDVREVLLMTARTLIESEPNYDAITTRLLLDKIGREALGALDVPIPDPCVGEAIAESYPAAFKAFIAKGVRIGRLAPTMTRFDTDRLAKAIEPARDEQFGLVGLQTLYDRYFLRDEDDGDHRIELPQVFFMRVAMGLALAEDRIDERAIEFYELISSFNYMCATPTLFNSGTVRPQLSSCFLTTVPDSLDGIFDAIGANARLAKWAGGLGNDWTPVRGMGAKIKGTNGKAQGVVPFLKIVNDTANAVDQGGKRRGAVCAYLETWHLDIVEFLDLRKNTGDDRRRTHDMNTANWIPDLFMRRVTENGQWTLFSPDETSDLHDLYGAEFERRYVEYERMADDGELAQSKRLSARELWRSMLNMIYETGHPWITFKDACNIRSPQRHDGVVHSSNLCTEITLNTSEDEIAVCNLGSVNLGQHIKNGELDEGKLSRTVRTAMRMLDNAIDLNFYAVSQARRSNQRHRPLGLGVMGVRDALAKMRIPMASDAAVEFADASTEAISFHAIEASTQLAKERGVYETYEGSLWCQGVLPIDTTSMLATERGDFPVDQGVFNKDVRQEWHRVRQAVARHGMRNSNVMAIAPTATIANIVGASASIEPCYSNLFVKSSLSGEFTEINKHLVSDLKERGLWDAAMASDLKHYDGHLHDIERVPADLKELYKTAFEIEPRWLVEAAARRQKWIDQAQSLNLYVANPSGKQLDSLYRMAWYLGLKTTYYLRSLGSTSVEKSTGAHGALNAVPVATQPAAVCAIDDPDCEACQ